ncbi:hypothetical protein D3C76_1167940 [compost metagenome]
MRSQYQYFAAHIQGFDTRDNSKPVQFGNTNIEDDHLRRQVAHQLNSIESIVCFTHHAHAVLFQQDPDGKSNDRMIVNYQNAMHSVIFTLRKRLLRNGTTWAVKG